MQLIPEIQEHYKNIQNEDKRLYLDRSHNLEFITTMHYLKKVCMPGDKVLDACAGTGAYCFELAKMGCKVTAGDLIQENVDIIKQKNKNLLLQDIYLGNILDLSMFEDNTFDVVLCLGAFYHIHNEAKRKQAILECRRIVKDGGIIVVAYLNRYASFIRNFKMEPLNIDKVLNEFHTGVKNFFYRSTPKEIEQVMVECNILKMHNVVTDGFSFLFIEELENLSDIDYKKYLDFHLKICEDENILGASLHGLFIGTK